MRYRSLETRISHLAYAPEIALAMLQRQRHRLSYLPWVVEGAVGMVEMRHTKMEKNIIELDEERKEAAMVSNLLVVLCERQAYRRLNTGTLYH
jgi:hypothetical protein